MTGLKTLIVEDSPEDAELAVHALHHAGLQPDWTRVETESDFLLALKSNPDIILCDYSLPAFSGLRAMELLRASGLEIPLILISGTVGEEEAVAAMQHGATDYLLKDRITRLGGAVERALEERRLRTERKQAEEVLRWKTAFLEAQVHSALDGLLVVDGRGKIILRNQQLADMWLIPREISESCDDAQHLQFVMNQTIYPARFAAKVAYLYAHPAEISRDEIELIDGRFFDRYSAPVQDKTGNHFGRIWTFRDITKDKKAEAALRLSEAQLRATFESAAIGMALVNPEGRPIKCNPALMRMLGYTEAELCGMTFSEFTHLEDRELDLRLFRELLAGAREKYEIEKRFVRRDHEIVLGRLTVSLIGQAEGRPPLAIGMVEDITEKRKLEEQFRQSQKMEAIGQLASGVAHDFNNILAVIQMQVGMLQTEGKLSPAQADHAAGINLASQHAADLTRQLLLFGRRQIMQPRDLDLNHAIEHISTMIQRILGEDIRLDFKYANEASFIHADESMIDQVLMNLSVNSRDAMPKGGKLEFDISAVEFDEATAALSPPARAGSFVCLSASDTGCGIAPEILSRIFDPFFTTKNVGKGTGLGLATVFGIMQQHQGWISVISEVDRGTTFKLYFPRVNSPVADKQRPQMKNILTGGHETILLVEDDLSLRSLVENALSRLGYRVLSAGSGLQAKTIWDTRRQEIDLLLTDLVMPDGINGRELAEHLSHDKPSLKVIYTSGYSTDVIGNGTLIQESLNFLNKPFEFSTLAKTVRNCLDN